jgi:hypothetical protein
VTDSTGLYLTVYSRNEGDTRRLPLALPAWVVSTGDGRVVDSHLEVFPDAPPCHS